MFLRALSRNWSAKRNILFVLLLAAPAAAQQLRFAPLGDFKLENGSIIRDCRVGYRAFGQLNAAKSNAVLFPTWFTGNTEALIPYIGPGKMVDSSRFFVIAVDALGDGVSSSPSTSKSQPGAQFPEFTIRDMVESQYRLLTTTLGIRHLHAVIGISMGGMQTFQWMIAHPDFMDKAVPIVGTPRLTSTDLILWQAELSALENARSLDAGMSTVTAIHAFALTTPEYRAAHTPAAGYRKFLSDQEHGAAKTFTPQDWLRQLQAMMALDAYRPFGDSPEKAAKTVRARTLVVVSLHDHMVNPQPALDLARLIKAKTLEVDTNCGHLLFDCEGPKVKSAVSAFLAN